VSRTVADGAHEVPAGPLLLLSPHLDDAVFSCAGLLDRPEPVDVLTVFAGAPEPPRQGWWDQWCGFTSSVESMAARQREDEAAFRGSRHRRTFLRFVESQYLDGARAEAERAAIGEAVAAWGDRSGRGTVAVPAGAGRKLIRGAWRLVAFAPRRFGFIQNPDHVFVRDSVLAVLSRSETLAGLLYEELPYLWTKPADVEVAAAASAWEFTAGALVVPVDRRAKASRIAAYASQLPRLDTRSSRLDDPDSLPGVERYWRLKWPNPRARPKQAGALDDP
jgi:LmbE family N-acetylglucosaminyl deacetylase